MTKVEKFGPCGCGSCEDAIRAALRYRNMSANADDCQIYRLRVAAAMVAMAMMEFKNEAVKEITGIDALVHDPMRMMSVKEIFAATSISAKAESEAVDEIGNIQSLFNGFIGGLVDAVRGKYVAEEVKAH